MRDDESCHGEYSLVVALVSSSSLCPGARCNPPVAAARSASGANAESSKSRCLPTSDYHLYENRERSAPTQRSATPADGARDAAPTYGALSPRSCLRNQQYERAAQLECARPRYHADAWLPAAASRPPGDIPGMPSGAPAHVAQLRPTTRRQQKRQLPRCRDAPLTKNACHRPAESQTAAPPEIAPIN